MSGAVNGDGIKPSLRPSKAAEKAAAAAEARQRERAKAAGAVPPPEAEEDGKPRRRRRPDRETIGNAAKRLAGWHAVIAAMMKAPELQISEGEAEQLVIVGGDLAAEFDLEVSGKAAAIVAMVGTAAAVYYPRLIAMAMRVQAQREKAQREAGGTVVDGIAEPMPQ